MCLFAVGEVSVVASLSNLHHAVAATREIAIDAGVAFGVARQGIRAIRIRGAF